MAWLKAMSEKEPPEPDNPIATVVIGNLKPDLHDTPKEMVRKSLKKAGFKCINLGKGVDPSIFASKAKDEEAHIIIASVNTSAAKNNLSALDKALADADLKGKIPLLIGGAVVRKEDADAIGAQYGKNRDDAVTLAKSCVK
jgi:methanogenic corrinoid protein MtbC1